MRFREESLISGRRGYDAEEVDALLKELDKDIEILKKKLDLFGEMLAEAREV